MNKNELVTVIAKSTGLSKADVTKVIDSFLETITKTLKKGGKISLVGYLTFAKTKRKATTGRNPRTGETIKIAAKNIVKTTIGKKIKDAIN